MTSLPAPNMTAAQQAFNTNEMLEAILYQIDDQRELLRLALLSKTAKDVAYGASKVGQKLSFAKARLLPPIWEVDSKNSTIVNRTADHTLTAQERAAGLKLLKPVVLNDFLLFDRHYPNLSLIKRLHVDTRVAGWRVHLGLLQHALQARPECTILRMFLCKPPVEEVELAWMRPHPNGGYGSSGTMQLSVAGGVRLRDVVSQITIMQSNGLRVGDLTIPGHLFVSTEQWNRVDALLSRPSRKPAKVFRFNVARHAFGDSAIAAAILSHLPLAEAKRGALICRGASQAVSDAVSGVQGCSSDLRQTLCLTPTSTSSKTLIWALDGKTHRIDQKFTTHSKHKVPQGLTLQDLVDVWGTTRRHRPHRLNDNLFARQHGIFDFTTFDGAICRLTTVYLPSNVFLYGTQITQPPVSAVFVDFWPVHPSSSGAELDTEFQHDQGPEKLQLGNQTAVRIDNDDGVTFGNIQEAYLKLSDELQNTASTETLVFLPWVCSPTELERDAVARGVLIDSVED